MLASAGDCCECHQLASLGLGFCFVRWRCLYECIETFLPTQLTDISSRFAADFHPDQFYKVHSSTENGIACHRKTGLAGAYGAETTDCDSPFSLVNATFDWLEQSLKDDIDFVIWTGDSARHDSDEKHPRSADEVLETNRIIADKFADVFSSKHGGLEVPVIPTWGNNDFLPHNIFYPGPNKWLRHYAEIWHKFIPEAQRHSFQFGGWFSVEVIPNQLAVFSLNTMYFFDRNAGVDGCADPSEPGFAHMEWLRVQLGLLRARGMKAILIGHVPPARTSSKQNWDETCWQRYTLWLKQYRDVVTASLYGHMNIDHFLLQDTREVNLELGMSEFNTRQALDEHMSIESKEDYLQDLRKGWSDLPGAAIKMLSEDKAEVDVSKRGKKHKKKKKQKDKHKKIGGKYAERYHLALVSPSIVPNYFPTMRVIEYNITGLEDAAVWTDTVKQNTPADSLLEYEYELETDDDDADDDANLELKRDLWTERKKNKKNKKKKKGKKGKKKKPKDPDLVIPDDPPKGSTPGPAYFPQPLTLTGYTQYFANLTYINNDLTNSKVDGQKWHDGDYGDDDVPNHKHAKPHQFKFQVEYSTFDDKYYKLKDLTVKNYLKLAYKMSKPMKGKSSALAIEDDDLEAQDYEMDVQARETDADGDNETIENVESGSGLNDADFDDEEDMNTQKKGKKNKKKKHKKNKTWLSFLDRAFVGTMAEEDLERMA